MSHKSVNRPEDNTVGYGLSEGILYSNREEMDIVRDNDLEESSFSELEERVERMKNDVKNLKKIRKQQEKLGKLEIKKHEILKEIEKEQEKEKKTRDRNDKRKKK